MKIIINLSLLIVLTLSLSVVASAQYGIVKLSNGITVVVRTKITPSNPKSTLGNIYSSNSGNTIHRVLTDKENKIYFGYDLLFVKEGEGKFKVSIKPLSKSPGAILNSSKAGTNKQGTRAIAANGRGLSHGSKGFGQVHLIYGSDFSKYTEKTLPNYPKDFVLNDGDTVSLDLLQNPKTNTKITDVIQISAKPDAFQYYYSNENPVKDFTLDEIYLRLEKPDVYINGKKYETRSTVAGNINWIYINGKGRFIFSYKPQTRYNFQKIGVIKNNEISFDFNGEKYRFVSKSPILAAGGKWNLWVMHDPNYQPNSEVSKDYPFIFGAAGKVENVFNKR